MTAKKWPFKPRSPSFRLPLTGHARNFPPPPRWALRLDASPLARLASRGTGGEQQKDSVYLLQTGDLAWAKPTRPSSTGGIWRPRSMRRQAPGTLWFPARGTSDPPGRHAVVKTRCSGSRRVLGLQREWPQHYLRGDSGLAPATHCRSGASTADAASGFSSKLTHYRHRTGDRQRTSRSPQGSPTE